MQFELNEKTFKINDIPTETQFHLLRKLAPVIEPLMKAAKKEGSDEMEIVSGLADIISEMEDSRADFCLYTLLDAISIKEDKGIAWSRIVAPCKTRLAYSNINVLEMMTLAYRSFIHNFKDCFQSLPSNLTGILQQTESKTTT